MLVISGQSSGRRHRARHTVSISQSRCLSFQAVCGRRRKDVLFSVSISQSRCLSFQVNCRFLCSLFRLRVSISQSRCLSFQVHFQARRLVDGDNLSFNLAIEMLVISGFYGDAEAVNNTIVSISQSRCLSFQVVNLEAEIAGIMASFNLAIEMLVISGKPYRSLWDLTTEFQSRNRDACHFRAGRDWHCARHGNWVSISQSRCLSFQVTDDTVAALHGELLFQSRNRDACHFRRKMTTFGCGLPFRFNLAIEMLVISG